MTKEPNNALPADADRGDTDRPGDRAIQAELNFYRELFGAVCVLYERSQALDQVAANPDDEATQAAWNAYWDAEEDVFDFVRTEEHAAAMEAAGVTCNELHHSEVTLSA